MIFVVMEKGKNDMARYTDIDKLIAEYDRVHIGPAGGARKLMVEAPIADVVPREEVEKIFEEIDKVLNRKIRRSEPEYERLQESYEKLSDIGHSHHGYFKGIISTCEDLQDIVAELKKRDIRRANDER